MLLLVTLLILPTNAAHQSVLKVSIHVDICGACLSMAAYSQLALSLPGKDRPAIAQCPAISCRAVCHLFAA